jgi:hypothetical protein
MSCKWKKYIEASITKEIHVSYEKFGWKISNLLLVTQFFLVPFAPTDVTGEAPEIIGGGTILRFWHLELGGFVTYDLLEFDAHHSRDGKFLITKI